LPRLLLAYHFFYPDDVISARHFGDLAEQQQRRGWEVDVLTTNRSCRDRTRTFSSHEDWRGVQIHRVFRPNWDQAKPLSRLANSAWTTAAWLERLRRLGKFDAVVIGSDPAFSPTLGRGVRRLMPDAAIVHWCFDLYPEAIAAEGVGGASELLVPIARRLMKWSYGAYDELVDLGPRMRERLAGYDTGIVQSTLVPWAIVEPARPAAADPRVRAELFPRAKMALLYSGTMGRAHDYGAFLDLARVCRMRSGDDVAFCFSSRGNRYDALRAAVTPADTNITFAPFADESALQARLEAADMHLLSLNPEWAGVVVPSKFFGSLAVSRPVLYAGPPDSEIARWIAQYDVGLALGAGGVPAAADRLHALLRDPQDLSRWQVNAFDVYQREFSKKVVNDRWDQLLRAAVARRSR
jgi:glycosyltransferase involved in cell wall biosynthesis